MANLADEVLKEIKDLENKKQQAIKELLDERKVIDEKLKLLGHSEVKKAGRPAGYSPNAAAKKAAS